MIGHLFIPNDAWQEDEEGRLNAQVNLNGHYLHITALPVLPLKDGDVAYMGTTEFVDNYISDLTEAFGASEPFETMAIKGNQYLVFLCPSAV